MAPESRISAAGCLSFDCLPQEIRDEIYRLVLVERYRRQNIKLRPPSYWLDQWFEMDVVNLLTVSKQVHKEAGLIFYTENAFRVYVGFFGPSEAQSCATKIAYALTRIRDLELHVCLQYHPSCPLVALADAWRGRTDISRLSLVVTTLSCSLSNPSRFRSGYTFSEAQEQFAKAFAPLWRIQGVRTVMWTLEPNNTSSFDYNQDFKTFEAKYLQDLTERMAEKPETTDLKL